MKKFRVQKRLHTEFCGGPFLPITSSYGVLTYFKDVRLLSSGCFDNVNSYFKNYLLLNESFLNKKDLGLRIYILKANYL